MKNYISKNFPRSIVMLVFLAIIMMILSACETKEQKAITNMKRSMVGGLKDIGYGNTLGYEPSTDSVDMYETKNGGIVYALESPQDGYLFYSPESSMPIQVLNMKAKEKFTKITKYDGDDALQVVKEYVSAKFNSMDLNKSQNPDFMEGTPEIVRAAFYGESQRVVYLIDSGIDVNSKTTYNETALFQAAYKGDMIEVEALLEAGADPNIKNNDGKSPLYIACEANQTLSVKMLLKYKADPKVITNELKMTAIMATSVYFDSEPSLELIKMLIDAGVNINAKDVNGKTALMLAQEAGKADMVKLLKQSGAK
jgi:hypothetical protein